MTNDEFESQLRALVRAHDDERDSYALCVLYEAASPEQRDALRRQVDLRDAWRFPDTTTLADGVARNAPPSERVRDALIWHAIEGGEDPRDNLCDIVLVYHAARRLDLDVDALLREVAAIAPEAIAPAIASFPQRKPEDRSLEAFDWRETPTSTGGVRYEEFDGWLHRLPVLDLPLDDEEHPGIPLHCGCDVGGVHLAIHSSDGFLGVPTRNAQSPAIVLSTSKIRDVFERLTAHGVRTIGPTDHGFGSVVAFRDPDGNSIEILEEYPEANQ